MNENEAKAREALKVWKQVDQWLTWERTHPRGPEPTIPSHGDLVIATRTLAAFAAEILERNP